MTDEREFPGFDHVYELFTSGATRAYHGKITDDAQAERIEKAMRSNGLLDDEPIRITHLMGGAVPGDVFWADAIIGPFVSTRVIDLLIAEQVTGWTSYATEAATKTGTVLDGYRLLMAVGRPCAVLDFTKGERKQFTAASNRYYFVGAQFDVATWNGSDIFRSGVSTPLLAMERVKVLLQRARVSNLRATRLTELEKSEHEAEELLGAPWWRNYGSNAEEAIRNLGWEQLIRLLPLTPDNQVAWIEYMESLRPAENDQPDE